MPEKSSSEHFLLGPLSLRNSQISHDWKSPDCKTEIFGLYSHEKLSVCTHYQRKATSYKLNSQHIIKDFSFSMVVHGYWKL